MNLCHGAKVTTLNASGKPVQVVVDHPLSSSDGWTEGSWFARAAGRAWVVLEPADENVCWMLGHDEETADALRAVQALSSAARRITKAVSFTMMYGASPQTIQRRGRRRRP